MVLEFELESRGSNSRTVLFAVYSEPGSVGGGRFCKAVMLILSGPLWPVVALPMPEMVAASLELDSVGEIVNMARCVEVGDSSGRRLKVRDKRRRNTVAILDATCNDLFVARGVGRTEARGSPW